MNPHLLNILHWITENQQLSDVEKKEIEKALKEADRLEQLNQFKIDRAADDRRTLSIMLEESLEDLEHKRIAVEEKNRDLEIEASLERVRTVAMGMRKPDELLNICQILFEELVALGFSEIRNAMINVFDNDKSSFLNYDYSPDAGQTITHHFYNGHPVIEKMVNESRSAEDAFSETVFAGTDLDDWKALRKQKGEKDDPRVDNLTALYYYFYSVGAAAIGMSTFSPIDEEKRNILKRFRNVFDFAYRRYTDVSQAEAQAREAQIELALERVRARTMAMQKSDELPEAANLLFQQVQELGMPAWSAGYAIWDEDKKSCTLYMSSEGVLQPPFRAPLTEEASFIHFYEAWQRGETFHVEEIGGEALVEHYKYMRTLPVVGEILDNIFDAGFPVPTFQIFHSVYFSQGFLLFITYEPVPAAWDIFKRFRKVFEQTYTRFLDLKKAEAQAREGQIELALERVRARTMAMQRSEELPETASVLFQQFKDLGGDPIQITIGIVNEAEGVIEFSVTDWRGGGFEIGGSFKGSIDEPTLLNKEYKAWKAKKTSLIVDLTGQELQDWIAYRNIWSNTIARSEDTFGRRVVSFAFFSKGHISISTTELPPPETIRLLERFASVFDGTYTRFLDLQKAEAQAREAQIELALERVRSRAMAMHKTDELLDAAELLYKEVTELGIGSLSVCYVLVNEENKTGAYYGINPVDGKIIVPPMIAPHTETKVMRSLWASWLKQELVHFIALDPKASLEHQTYIGNIMAAAFKQHGTAEGFTVEGFLAVSPERVHIYSLNFKQGYLFLVGGAPLAAADIDILTRFTKVFELTYTRFLDLQKAETQAREGKIELALERVRARTMAMQHSDELAETAYILFQQFRELGENPDQATIGIINEAEGVIEYWVTLYGSQTNRVYKFPIDEPNVTNKIYKAWKARKKSLMIDLTGKALYEFSNFRAGMGGAAYNPDEKRRIINVAFFSRGLINVQSTAERSVESLRLLERFANVFDSTYTRFLDLKNAEAQARESQIQLALERVRAKTMAMQHSDELRDVVLAIYQQLQGLGFEANACNIIIMDNVSGDMDYWVSGFTRETYPESYHVPYIKHPFIDSQLESWRQNEKYSIFEYSGKMKKDFDKIFFTQTDFRNVPEEAKKFMIGLKSLKLSTAFISYGSLQVLGPEALSEENALTLQRFAKVFEQTYTRFLDLQKAEAQTRESQIQLALERVRARTMAMQQSTELAETASLVSQQLQALGLLFSRVGFYIWKKDAGLVEGWTSNGNFDGLLPPLVLPFMEDEGHRGIYEAAQRGEHSYEQVLGGDELKRHYEWLLSQPSVWGTLRTTGDNAFVPMPIQYKYAGIFKQGYLMLMATEPQPGAGNLLERFALVFEQTYTRFLDLKNAEEQARESQIQLAMERVRAKTMAMQRSDELADAASLLFKQVADLGTKSWSSGFMIGEPEDNSINSWMSKPDGSMGVPFNIPLTEDSFFINIYKARQRGEDFYVMDSGGKELEETYRYMFSLPGAGKALGAIQNLGFQMPTFQITHCVFFSHGFLMFITYEPCPEMWDIFKRFGNVFEQTYTRFLDLQKAEAQARESQIQLGLERVRARTMAMQRSGELGDVATILFKELNQLVENLWTCGFVLCEKDRTADEWWVCIETGFIPAFFIPNIGDATHENIYNGWKNGESFHVEQLEGEVLNEHYDWLYKIPAVKGIFDEMIAGGFPLPTWQKLHCAYFSQGYLVMITQVPCPEEEIFKRFAQAFDQTYTRFLDLQRAEAQAREAKIEAGLERVRAKAMAMHSSADLAEAVGVFYHELGLLSVTPRRCGLGLIDKETRLVELSTMNTIDQGNFIEIIGELKLAGHPILEGIYDNWLRQEEYHPVLRGNNIKAYYQVIQAQISYPDYPDDAVQFGYYFFFRDGGIFAWTETELPEAEVQIYRRFNSVISLTYRRYKDIKEAEAQAREAQIELALERVRARTMAMQKSDELQEIIKVVYEQFVHLNIPVEHAGFIMDYNTRDDMHIWLADKHYAPAEVTIPYFDSPHWNSFNEAKKTGSNFFSNFHTFEEKNKFYHDLFKLIPGVTDETKDYYLSCPGLAISTVLLENVGLYIENFSGTPYTDGENTMLMRFGKVFQQTYTRFLDLQKAEAQAREAQIEAALERVRSRTMGMQRSDELREVIQVIYEQLQQLNLKNFTAGFLMDYRKSNDFDVWLADPGHSYPKKVHYPYLDHPIYNRLIEAREKGLDFLVNSVTFEEKNQFLDHVFKYLPAVPEDKQHFKEAVYSSPGYIASVVLMKNVALFIENFEGIPFPEEENAILKRFGKVFEQTYTRFKDLEQAEEQAREAQIELGLERVRARAMAMQNSSELADLVDTVFKELTKLDFALTRCMIRIYEADTLAVTMWMANPEINKTPLSYRLEPIEIPFEKAAIRAWKERNPKWVYEFGGQEKKAADKKYFSETELHHLPQIVQKSMRAIESVVLSVAFYNFGGLQTGSLEPLSEDKLSILSRFAKAFDLTYTRFNDLQKAEAQAREARIEAALEKVRSRSLAMHKPGELQEVVNLVSEKLHEMGIALDAVNIAIPDEKNKSQIMWIAVNGIPYPKSVQIPYNDDPISKSGWEAWFSGVDYFANAYTFDEKNEFFNWAFEHSDLKYMPAERKAWVLQSEGYAYSAARGKVSAIWAVSYSGKLLNAKEGEILKRFGRVFDQAYIRFLDLQKAEAQAREAQIEASLERVRSKAMAMRNSGDLSAAASTVFTELRNLGINPIRSGVGLLTAESAKAKIYSNTSTQTTTDLSLMGEVTLGGHPAFERQYKSWLKQENYFVALGGKELASYYKILSAGLHADLGITVKKNQKEYGHWFMFSEGFLYAWSDKEYTDAEIKILERFKNVIELTFRRYIELQKSEAQARDAIRQASLDRVRAEIASMRSTEDLERIIPLVWNELTILAVPFIRCGVFIVDEDAEVIHTHLSTPDGRALAAFDLHFDADGIGQNVLPAWRKKQIAAIHWTAEEFAANTKSLVDRGAVKSKERFVTEHPDTSLDLHFFPFLQGMLYVGNIESLNDDAKDLVQSLADAFSTAYARYEDFNKLEAAKQQVDKTLTDLKAAQTQLIQTEKMASLGELTAGIAHEIQNPLNFVNNFSEVNAELIDEMEEEIEKGDLEEIKAIALDIKENSKKISMHGKRADGIVKGMLQHSKSGSGAKEPTNINSVADEYMRLAYHGLRAKDKSFSAEMVTHFDPKLPKITVIGQDIGRVMLNLFNNAFYAVSKKQKTAGEGYKAEVSVSTAVEKGQVVIKVKDNGVGIPDAIKDKIMQPFFTTKPTGEGTGLGLSLTYDMVVKGHGGKIEVNTKEGEFTEFIVSLPLN